MRQIPEDARQGRLSVRALAIVDWYDGPLAGIARFSGYSTLWRFRLLAEEPRGSEVDDRLFEFASLPSDTPAAVREAVASVTGFPLLSPKGDQPAPSVVSAIEALMAADVPAELIVRTSTFDAVTQVWLVATPADYS